MSRHLKIQCSRSKAILIAAGALSVATAPATGVTWTSGGASARTAPSAGQTATTTSSLPRLTVTDRLDRPPGTIAYQLTSDTLAERTYQVRAAQSSYAVAQWTAARQRATTQATQAAAVARAAAKTAATAAQTSLVPAATQPQTTASVSSGSPQQIARAMLGSFGWSSSQFGCLDPLWAHESGWSVTAENPSGAYGIPQALPGGKMASAGPDWQTDAATQIKWGLEYIKHTYGSPCAAWNHEQATGWY